MKPSPRSKVEFLALTYTCLIVSDQENYQVVIFYFAVYCYHEQNGAVCFFVFEIIF